MLFQNKKFQIKKAVPPLSLHGQLLWREFFYCAATKNPNFDRMQGNPICVQIPWDKNAEALAKWANVSDILHDRKVTEVLRNFARTARSTKKILKRREKYYSNYIDFHSRGYYTKKYLIELKTAVSEG